MVETPVAGKFMVETPVAGKFMVETPVAGKFMVGVVGDFTLQSMGQTKIFWLRGPGVLSEVKSTVSYLPKAIQLLAFSSRCRELHCCGMC